MSDRSKRQSSVYIGHNSASNISESDMYLLYGYCGKNGSHALNSSRAMKMFSGQISKYGYIIRKTLSQHLTKNKINGIIRNRKSKVKSRVYSYSEIDLVSNAPTSVLPSHVIYWAHKQEAGYKYNLKQDKEPIHEELEDVLKISVEDFASIKKQDVSRGTELPMQVYTRNTLGTYPGSKLFLFVLADGHGGSGAANFFVNKTQETITLLVESKRWDLSLENDRELFEKEVVKIFNSLDAMFIEKKLRAYREMNEKKNLEGGQVRNQDENIKIRDDGCTLVVNILYQNYLININTGDSRTIVATKPSGDRPLECLFISDDHNMTHRQKVRHAYEKGGKFISREGVTAKVVSPENTDLPLGENIGSIFTSTSKNSVSGEMDKSFCNGFGLRLYRPANKQLKDLNFPCNKTLNLSAAMGDVLFKVEPSIVSCSPDVKFIKLSLEKEYLIIAATDGIWDHIDTTRDEKMGKICSLGQVCNTFEYYGVQTNLTLMLSNIMLYSPCSCEKDGSGRKSSIASNRIYVPPYDVNDTNTSKIRNNKASKLNDLVDVLVSREPAKPYCRCTEKFFYKHLSRYDDSTCIAILLEPSTMRDI